MDDEWTTELVAPEATDRLWEDLRDGEGSPFWMDAWACFAVLIDLEQLFYLTWDI